MKIDTTKIVRGVVERVSESHLVVLTSAGQQLALGLYCGMYPKSPDEWVSKGYAIGIQGDAIVLFGEGEDAVWVHAEDYAGHIRQGN